MKILLDENIPIQLRDFFPGHAVASINDLELSWKSISNGRLLAEMEGRFDLLITADRNMYAQQNLSGRSIAILVLPTNRRKDVLALSRQIAALVNGISTGEYVTLEKNGDVQKKIAR